VYPNNTEEHVCIPTTPKKHTLLFKNKRNTLSVRDASIIPNGILAPVPVA
jgi:hypothetical protein